MGAGAEAAELLLARLSAHLQAVCEGAEPRLELAAAKEARGEWEWQRRPGVKGSSKRVKVGVRVAKEARGEWEQGRSQGSERVAKEARGAMEVAKSK